MNLIKTIIYISIFAFLNVNVYAQTKPTLTLGTAQPREFDELGSFGKTLAYIDGVHYSVQKINNDDLIRSVDLGIVAYDKNSKILFAKKVVIKEEGKELDTRHIEYMNDKFYAIATYRNQSQKRFFIFVCTLNPQTFEPNNDLSKVIDVSLSNKRLGFEFKQQPLVVNISDDKTKLAITTIDETSKEIEVSIGVIDNNLNVLSNYKTPAEVFNKETFELKDIAVNNVGDVVVGTMSRDENKHYIHCYTYSSKTKLGKEYYLNPDNEGSNEFKLKALPNNNFVSFALIIDKESNEGFIYHEIDANEGKVLKTNIHLFKTNDLKGAITTSDYNHMKKREEKGKPVYISMTPKIRDLYIDDEMNTWIIAENEQYSQGYTILYNIYVYKVLYADAKLHWIKAIPKIVYLDNNNRIGILAHKHENALDIIYAESSQNFSTLDLDSYKKTFLYINYGIVCTHISNDGKLTKTVLLEKENKPNLPLENSYYQINPKEGVFMTRFIGRGRYEKMGWIKF